MGGAAQVAMRVALQIWQVVFASQTLQVFCLALRKKAQYVVVINASICHSNQCDVLPFKNLGKKLSHSIVILKLVPIQALLYSLKTTSRSSPFLPLKIGLTMIIFSKR
jgi:hypothetical protein